jgi:acetylornithine deacetylase/succinyl-diaminopimelate desuccinylase-like protein
MERSQTPGLIRKASMSTHGWDPAIGSQTAQCMERLVLEERGADIRFLNLYGETPTVIFGPGMTEQMHANNEWAAVADLIEATKILALTIIEWCGVEEQTSTAGR